MAKSGPKVPEQFTIKSFTRAGAARLSKFYRDIGYVPVRDWHDPESDMHCVTYEEQEKKIV